MNDYFVDSNETAENQWFDKRTELLAQLSPSVDYEPAVDYFSSFGRRKLQLIEGCLDGRGHRFEGCSCRFPIMSEEDGDFFPKGVLFVQDLTFGDQESQNCHELLMPYAEFLRWLRALARLWSKIYPADEATLRRLFHERNLACLESEVGKGFDNGATWWRKIEEQRRTAIETCRTCLCSPQWRYAADYFCWLSDSHFPTWLRSLIEGHDLPSLLSIQAQRLANGGIKFSTPSWRREAGQYIEITPVELDIVLSKLVEGFANRRPHRAEEVQQLLGEIKSRS